MSKFRVFRPLRLRVFPNPAKKGVNTLLLHGQSKCQQGTLTSGTGKLIIYTGDGKRQPFIEFNGKSGIQLQDVVLPIVDYILQEPCRIEGIPILHDKMTQEPERVAHRLVTVPLKDIPIGTAIKAIIQIPFFKKETITEDDDSLLFIEEVIPGPKPGLQLVVDKQGNTGIVGDKPPVIEMPEGFV